MATSDGGLVVSYVFSRDPYLDDSFPTWLIFVVVVVAVVSIFLVLYKVYIFIQSPARNPAQRSEIEFTYSRIDESILERLPTIVFQSLEKTDVPYKKAECVICLGKYALNDTLLVLRPCWHLFHVDCIQTHFTHSTTCPVCRQPILLDGDDLDV